ncbi:molybdopterin biosynthesis protein MoeB [Comamonas serinivorans]|uniref:Molybdopterin-synthase adenylyltransferase n=1 Tax=Comamonas serinivorans TaxID=1082851 RepID=A0A1Y0ERJ0_9BURK|nr:molybdopterin-synthase adenylyltransferase MoeB [Comamonas serinivorans]ARU05872.1 molybdopterin biosynthesis protein MoeB [Comamonas serinivorans]
MNDDQLLRYSRHILLDEIGIEGQERLLASTALIVGAGGLGSPAALYLAAAGVGRLVLVDHDDVDLTNLQRQIAHTQARVGQPKVASAKLAMLALNGQAHITTHARCADDALLAELVPQADVVLDCTDNFEVRQRINAACVRHRKPLASGSAIRFAGQVSSFDLRQAESPCYACLFPPEQQVEAVACATLGVFAPLVGIVGSIQAAEALKLLLYLPSHLQTSLLLVDAMTMRFDELRLTRDAHCPVCGTTAHPPAAVGLNDAATSDPAYTHCGSSATTPSGGAA